MKITLRQILEIYQVLRQITSNKMPVKAAYAFGKNHRIAERIVKEFESIREEIIKTHTVKDDNGDPIQILYTTDPETPTEIVWDAKNDTKVPDGHAVGFKFDSHEAITAQFDELLEAEHEVSWFELKASSLDGFEIRGDLFVPLFDTVIVDDNAH